MQKGLTCQVQVAAEDVAFIFAQILVERYESIYSLPFQLGNSNADRYI